MQAAVEEFGWPPSMLHAVDTDGSLWSHLGVRYRGTWVLIDDDGSVKRTSPHPPASEVAKQIEAMISG